VAHSIAEFVLISAFGILLLCLLIVLARLRRRRPVADTPPLDNGASEFPSAEVVERIFSPADWKFVCGLGEPGLERMFLGERKDLALSWLARIRARSRGLVGVHVASVRQGRALSLRCEAKLMISVFVLSVLCEILAAAIALIGPFRTRYLVSCVQVLVERVSIMAMPSVLVEQAAQ
jgi:hypothetical protein